MLGIMCFAKLGWVTELLKTAYDQNNVSAPAFANMITLELL